MSKREPGFYWVRLMHCDGWEPARWAGDRWALLETAPLAIADGNLAEIGPHIVPPTIDQMRESQGLYCRLCKRESPLSCHMGGCPVGADL